MSQVAHTIAATSSFARQLKNPVARALRDLQKPLLACNLEGFQIGMAYQARPHNNRIVLRVPAPAGNKIEMITPAVMLKAGYLVRVKPLQAASRPLQILWLLGSAIEHQVPMGHIAPPFRGILWSHAHQRPQIYGA